MTPSRRRTTLLAAIVLLAPTAAGASGKEAWAALDRETAAACTAAAGLLDPTVSAPLRFSDGFGVDARLVRGTWPQAHMQGREGTMLCLYDRRTRRTEVQPADGWQAPGAETVDAAATSIRGVTWRATRLDGAAVVAGATITATFDAGGRVGGRSGCNSYSARYELEGTKLRVIPPMIGTRMACAPAPMEQERRYTALLEQASTARATPNGGLVIATADGRQLEFVRAAAAARGTDPSPPQYRCGGERVKLRLDETQAYAEFGDGVGITLPRLQPDATPGVRTYTNGKLTFMHSPDSAEPRIRMARGRMAPAPCAPVEE